jgi:hypothetical protein
MAWVHAIGKELIIVRNRNRASDGDIFIFDRQGKAVRKVNRLGRGPEEYPFLTSIILDEDNSEIFVNSHSSRNILVYDLFGNFKRGFSHKDGSRYGMEIYNFDRNHLICRDEFFGRDGFLENQNIFLVISKQDGNIVKEIEIPYKEKISSAVSGPRNVMPIRNRRLVPHHDNIFSLVETSSDTIYGLMPDYSMIPLIERIPAVQSMSPPVFLFPAVLTERYCFMQTVKNEWNWETQTGHDRVNLMYDRHEKALFECVVYNADFAGKQPVLMTSEVPFGNDEIALVQKLEVEDLVEALEKGQLKGKLKEIAATLNEESNPVLMLVKYSKQ